MDSSAEVSLKPVRGHLRKPDFVNSSGIPAQKSYFSYFVCLFLQGRLNSLVKGHNFIFLRFLLINGASKCYTMNHSIPNTKLLTYHCSLPLILADCSGERWIGFNGMPSSAASVC